MAESGAPTSGEYIVHHLTNLHAGEGFWTFHLDTLIVSGLLGLVVFGFMLLLARKASSGVPSGWQNFVEMVVSMVDAQVKDTFHAKSDLPRIASMPILFVPITSRKMKNAI